MVTARDVMGMRIGEKESPLMFDQEGKINKLKPKIGMEDVMRGAVGVSGGQERPKIDWKEVMEIGGTPSKPRISAEEVMGAHLGMGATSQIRRGSGNFMDGMLSRDSSPGKPNGLAVDEIMGLKPFIKGEPVMGAVRDPNLPPMGVKISMEEAMGLKPFVRGEPVMGSVRDPNLPPMGKSPGMSLAQSAGSRDPDGYDAATDTYAPGFVRDAVEQSRLKSEFPYQLDSAVANRMPTPETRAAMLADLSKQRLVAAETGPKGDDWAPIGGGSAINRKTGERSDAPAKVKDEPLYAWREGMPPRILIDEGTVGVVNPQTRNYELHPIKRQKIWGVDPATNKRGERMVSNYDIDGLVLYDEWKPEGAAAPSVELSVKDQGALDWVQANPKDPRAAKILERLGVW